MKSYLNPLFLQHHEDETALRNEIIQMKSVGIDSFIVEARPHPEYLDEGWWNDLSIIIDQAKKMSMKVWIFDDSDYPSGYANGLIEKYCPEHCKRYLSIRPLDARGPLSDSSFLVGDWIYPEEKLVSIIAAKQLEGSNIIEETSLTEISEFVQDGVLYWDVPEGNWRVFILVNTREGGEPHTRGYVNPISKEAVGKFIEFIYEAHYTRFKDDFGETIAGFFSDEPRFGNDPSYDFSLGDETKVLPWSDELMEELRLQKVIEGSIIAKLPLLWYEGDKSTPDVRYVYMDIVSKLFSEDFIGQIHDWCESHKVELIGHVIEENGSHSRLGYGPGHFFRAMQGFDIAGMDNVCNIYPGYREGFYKTHFNYFDATFNHWGLPKLTSSVASLDKNKRGRALSESFGAYGWSEGLKTMKWITDAMCVRGINIITPHAFSPKEYPDLDCPPHFYAQGMNPQWPFFEIWSNYANRVCDQLSDGKIISPVAVLYHAEAQWGGEAQTFEHIVKKMMEGLIDSTVISGDHLVNNTQVVNEQLIINELSFDVLVVPYSEYLPKQLVETLQMFSKKGVPIYFVDEFPKRLYGGDPFPPEGFVKLPLEEIVSNVGKYSDIKGEGQLDGLIYRHYVKNGKSRYFFVNENINQEIEGWIDLKEIESGYAYDPLNEKYFKLNRNETQKIHIRLEPYESIFFIFEVKEDLQKVQKSVLLSKKYQLKDNWKICMKAYNEKRFNEIKETELLNFAKPQYYPNFSGTIRYETQVSLEKLEGLMLDLGRVYEVVRIELNDIEVKRCICPPYRIALPIEIQKIGENKLVIEVTNTLVKANHENIYDRYWPQEPTGMLGPVVLSTIVS